MGRHATGLGMNDVTGGSGPPHDRNMAARVAVLEAIAVGTKQAIVDLRQEARETNRRLDVVRDTR